MVAFVAGGVYLAFGQNQKQHSALARIAASRGWQMTDPPGFRVPSLAHPGSYSQPQKGAVAQGQIGPFAAWFYFNDARYKNSDITTAMVISLQLPRPLPVMVLDGVANNMIISNLINRPEARGLLQLQLEGNFQNYFRLFIEPNQQIDVLQLITPEIMAKMIDLGILFDLDFDGQYVHIINTAKPDFNSPYTGKMLEFADMLAASLGHKLFSYNASQQPGQLNEKF